MWEQRWDGVGVNWKEINVREGEGREGEDSIGLGEKGKSEMEGKGMDEVEENFGRKEMRSEVRNEGKEIEGKKRKAKGME